jgi:OmpA family
VAASWDTQRPIRLIHLVGHTDPVGSDEYNRNLGGRRALEVQNALKAAIEALRPGLTGQITFIADTEGEQSPVGDNRTQEGRACNRRVEVFLPVQPPLPPTPPPPPPKVRIPTPEEEARKIEQERQEREERERRVRGTPLPPTPPPLKQRSFPEMFWRWLDGKLDDVLNRFRIPSRLRGQVRDLLYRAIQSGSESLLGQGLDALGVTGGAKQAVLGVFRAATQQKSP